MPSTYLDRPGVSHGGTYAPPCDKPYALSLSTTVATPARRDTYDLLMCLLFLNSTPPTTCARIATRHRWLCRCSLRTRKCPQPRRRTPLPAQHSTRARTGTRLLYIGLEFLALLAQDWRRWARCARTGTLPL